MTAQESAKVIPAPPPAQLPDRLAALKAFSPLQILSQPHGGGR